MINMRFHRFLLCVQVTAVPAVATIAIQYPTYSMKLATCLLLVSFIKSFIIIHQKHF